MLNFVRQFLLQAKDFGKKFLLKFVPKEERKNNHLYYIIGLIALILIIVEAVFLFRSGKKELVTEETVLPTLIMETEKFVVGLPEKNEETLKQIKKDLQGVNDSGFEGMAFVSGKNVATLNAKTESSQEQARWGKKSLKISWAEGQNKSVRLYNYLTVQKDQFYKLGLWISSEKDSQFRISLLGQNEELFPMTEVGVLANDKNKFRYYEYNFQSPADASGLEFFASGIEPSVIFVDEIKLVPLDISQEEELGSITQTVSGANQEKKIGENQINIQETSSALIFPKTSLGQVFTAQTDNLAGATFSIKKIGDGGVGEYILELREYDETNHKLAIKKIAMITFSAGDLKEEKQNFALFARLEPGKKYYLGFDNSNVSVDEKNHLLIGQANNNFAYAGGNGFLQKEGNKIFTEEKDLYFVLNYFDLNGQLPFGQTIYDLGNNQSRGDYILEANSGSNVLSLFESKNISSDKWQNLFLNDGESFLTYRISAEQKKMKKITLIGWSFHNNLKVEFSLDNQNWKEIFADNSQEGWQNTGKIEIDFKEDVSEAFFRLRKNGEKSCVFLGGQAVINLEK